MANDNPRIIEANDTRFTATFTDGSTHIMPNIDSYTENATETPTTQKPTLEGVGVIVGREQAPTLTFNIQALPHLPVYQKMQAAHANGEIVTFDYKTKQKTIFTGDGNVAKVTIDTDNSAEFTGAKKPDLTGSQFSIGDIIIANNETFVVTDIGDADSATVDPAPGAKLTDEAFVWAIPSIGRTSFSGRVTGFGTLQLTPEDSLTQTLSVQLTSTPPNITVRS